MMADETQHEDAALQTDASSDDAKQYTEVEALAMDMGWNPDFQPANGKAPRTAHDWIKSTNARNKSLTRQMDMMQANVDRIVAATDKQVKREVKRQAEEIQARFEAAVDAKDTRGAAAAAKDMRELEAEATPAATPDTNAVDRFKAENSWFGTDEEATAFAEAQSNLLAKRGVTDPERQLAEVVKAVRKRFPEHFEDATAEPAEQRRAPVLNAPSRPSQQRRTTTFGDMPEVARNAANRFYEAAKVRGTAPDRKAFEAQYAKDFFSDQAA